MNVHQPSPVTLSYNFPSKQLRIWRFNLCDLVIYWFVHERQRVSHLIYFYPKSFKLPGLLNYWEIIPHPTRRRLQCCRSFLTGIFTHSYIVVLELTWSVLRLFTGWMVRWLNLGGGKKFCVLIRLDRPRDPPSLLFYTYQSSFQGVKRLGSRRWSPASSSAFKLFSTSLFLTPKFAISQQRGRADAHVEGFWGPAESWNKAGNVQINVTSRPIRSTVVAVEKQ